MKVVGMTNVMSLVNRCCGIVSTGDCLDVVATPCIES